MFGASSTSPHSSSTPVSPCSQSTAITNGVVEGSPGCLSYAAGLQKLTEVAWKTVPSKYIICESDKAIPPSLQEVLARRAERVHRLSTSHSPFLSQPAALAQLIREQLAST
jgi:pimeloyl-ACP methyl ester carboxylesterase